MGRKACHVWFEQELAVYNAKIKKLKKNKVYCIAYWLDSEHYDDAEDYDIPQDQHASSRSSAWRPGILLELRSQWFDL